jgi:hypothetical protein
MIDRRRGSRGTGSRSWSSSIGRAMRCGNFTMKDLQEALRGEHDFKPSCRRVKAVLQSRGLGEVIEARVLACRYWAAPCGMTMPAKVLDAALGERRADLHRRRPVDLTPALGV